MRRPLHALRNALRDLGQEMTRERQAGSLDRDAAARQHLQATVATVRELAEPHLAAGTATMSVDGPTIRLQPRSPNAAPVELHVAWHQTDLLAGPHRNLHELCDLAVDERDRHLRVCLSAILDGRYEERLEPWRRGQKLTMLFAAPATEPIIVRHFSGEPQPTPQHVRYAAYTSRPTRVT